MGSYCMFLPDIEKYYHFVISFVYREIKISKPDNKGVFLTATVIQLNIK